MKTLLESFHFMSEQGGLMARGNFDKINFMDLIPRRMQRWKTDDEGIVTIFIPKFRNRYFGPWLTSFLKNPDFNLELDKIGSAVWCCCDGSSTVYEIAEKIKEAFGDSIEPLYDRLVPFVRQMIRGDLISCEPKPEDP